jgi:hypothetical protein
MTVGMSAEEVHQLRISMATDLMMSLTTETRGVLLDLVSAIDGLYKLKLSEEEGENDGCTDN